jgi:hypothetical protein
MDRSGEDALIHQLDHEGLEGLAPEVLTQGLLKLIGFHELHGIEGQSHRQRPGCQRAGDRFGEA